ncbi:hypothetical protein K458DRAFT_425323 [Lentithecium fluviatile CBS 122367]|uniref:Uncharacterized protein n=1 Tax=Lentithecium fluviatile CBS 122367 TaxID=1168545 RepID=A0A6G1ICD7_9PLEO|nr:hypothetical protein K458DRAFT_425323 [Lentithecium fluviatile CBS 122367]
MHVTDTLFSTSTASTVSPPCRYTQSTTRDAAAHLPRDREETSTVPDIQQTHLAEPRPPAPPPMQPQLPPETRRNLRLPRPTL